jgi:hypothetical protein
MEALLTRSAIVPREFIRAFPFPAQSPGEFVAMFQFLQSYFDGRGVARPVAVEFGIQSNLQKAFWLRYMAAEHIGIDCETRYSTPDIQGDILSPETVGKLEVILAGRKVDLFFFDAIMRSVAQVGEQVALYRRLLSPHGVLAFHVIGPTQAHPQAAKEFWTAFRAERFKEYDFVEFYSWLPPDHPCHRYQMGTGLALPRNTWE